MAKKMSDPIESFEIILKKQTAKRRLGLYRDSMPHINHSLKPQDVISSVFSQLKAMQVADSLKSEKCDLRKAKKSTFLCVNKLPVYQEVSRQTTKFDTQCVSDTQLINIIEDAELIDVHRGMTQEFETSFCRHTEKQSIENNDEAAEGLHRGHNKDVSMHIHLVSKEETVDGIQQKSLHQTENNTVADNSLSIISPIMCANNIRGKAAGYNSQDNENSQVGESTEDINKCIESEESDDNEDIFIKTPLSPIFLHKHVKTKSKTPSPLIFALDKFEQFEKIAIPILKAHDPKTAKYVINSQILDKELHIKMNEEILLNERDILSPVLENKNVNNVYNTSITNRLEFESDPLQAQDLQFIQLDKATSEELLTKIMKSPNSNPKIKAEGDILKDEILFSSDEEDLYAHKSYQDLPFTCALETSFYDQADVLDKTMYVGFQTASDKAIQIFTESFEQAKSLLIDVTSDEMTVTDLVKNGDSSNIRNKMEGTDEPEFKLDLNDNKTTKLNAVTKNNDQTNDHFTDKGIQELTQDSSNVDHNLKHTYDAFKTASKKDIMLSDNTLAKSNKVFKDIGLSENLCFNKVHSNTEKIQHSDNNSPGEANKSLVDNDIDDVIIQEFENIEMSLEEDKFAEKNVDTIGFKTASKKEIKISEVALTKTKDIFKDIDFDIDSSEIDITEKNIKRNSLLKIFKDENKSNKSDAIIEELKIVTNDISNDADSIRLTDKCSKSLQKNYKIISSYKQSLTGEPSIVGFKTANNKHIKISDKALAKTKTVFKDIDSIDFAFPQKNSKNLDRDTDKQSGYEQLSINKLSVACIKTDNNIIGEVQTPSEAVSKTKYNIFKDVDINLTTTSLNDMHDKEFGKLEDFYHLPTSILTKGKNQVQYCEILKTKHNNTEKLNNIIKSDFIGFKTANNRHITISDTALANTKNIFKDIDSIDFKYPLKSNKANEEDIRPEDKCVKAEMIDFIQPSTSTSKLGCFRKINNHKTNYHHSDQKDLTIPLTSKSEFVGFRTAYNKTIEISERSLAKTKDIFKEIEFTESKLRDMPDNDYPNIRKNEYDDNIGSSKKNNSTHIDGLEGYVMAGKTDITKNNNTKKDIPDNIVPEFQGFQTASNKHIGISADALVKSRKLFQDLDVTQNYNIKCKENQEMHKNIKCTISENRASPVFKEFELKNKLKHDYPVINKDEFDINTEYRNIKNLIHKDGTEGDVMPVDKDIVETIIPFPGFQTASNKQVKISADALVKSRKLFHDLEMAQGYKIGCKETETRLGIEIEDISNDNEVSHASEKASPVFNKFQAQSKNGFDDVIVVEKEITKNNNIGKSVPETTAPKFQGFQTASNKKVKVSADALVKSRKLFQDLNMTQDYNIDVSQIRIENDKHEIIENEDTCSVETVSSTDRKASPVFKGFQTADKNPVTVSKQALARSKKLFGDIHLACGKDYPEQEFHDKVVVSEKNCTDHKDLLQTKDEGSKGFKRLLTVSDQTALISIQTDKFIDNHLEIEKDDKRKSSNTNFGFQTRTNRDVLPFKDAIERTKRVFSDIDKPNVNLQHNRKEKNKHNDDIVIENIIDTQVLNNFEESLHTEDFHDTPIKSKRSGSPILSCPKAKRRKKFETPYSQILPKPAIINKDFINKNVNKVTFNENYKKNKKYTLKDLAKLKSDSTSIDPYLLELNFDKLLNFDFKDIRNGLCYDNMTMDLLKELFQNSVNNKLIPNGWLDNHIKLIIWKLISYEIRFKSNVVCSARNLMDQLKYRYDKELYNAERPALRKILEKDDVASKTLVLCVAGIYVDGVNVASVTTAENIELLVTDGWYCVKASIDKMLAQLVYHGKIDVGTKIVTNGAELVNCEQGISPWEDTSAVRLKLFGNSTRRARWDARLGYHGNGAILCQLSSVKLDGGKVSKLRVFVTRVYSALYVEKFEDGSTVTRSERLEHLHQMKSEAERQAVMEKIYEEVEREYSDQESQDSEGLSDSSSKRTCLDSGSQIAKVMKRSKDPAEFRAGLSSSQLGLLETHTSKRRELLLQDIQQRIRDKVEKAGVCVNRNVVTLLKIRVAGIVEKSGVEVTKGMMSIWKPNDAILDIVKEGAWLDVMNVVPTAMRYSEIQISAGRQSVFSISKYKEPEKFKPCTKLLQRNCYTIKDLSQNPLMSTDYNEIDTVGFIFLVDPSVQEFDSSKQPFQNIYLADADKNMICINFWGGLTKFGYQNVLDTGQIIACMNLQKRAGNTRKNIPQYRVTEYSYFTKTPKNENARNILDDLNKTLLSLDKRKFCEDCVVLKNNYTVFKYNNENISPYRINNCDINISKNKIFIDSPLARPNKMDDNFNLTGLDFESTFKQTDTQHLPENVLLRKQKVNEKIARLKMYGEPPPLSAIHIINKSKNASDSYKSPFSINDNSISNCKKENINSLHSRSDSSVNVASIKETPEKCADSNETDVICSPLLLNKTFVKSVNPVRINFDVKDNNDSNVDHFAEEFDGSPPLSLD